MKKIKEIEKTQLGRLNSVLIFSPIILYLSTRTQLTRWERDFLLIAGIGTLITTGIAYLENKKRLEQE